MRRFIAITCACVCGAAAIFAGSAGAAKPRTSKKVTRVSAWDEEWLKVSLEGDLFEVQGGRLAKSKSNNAAVTKLANTPIKDHSKSCKEGAQLARRLHIEAPTEPTPSEQWELQMLSKVSGRQFNYQYALLEVDDHRQDIEESTSEVRDGTNRDVRDNAKTELPTLRMHLRLSQQTVNAVK